jgi:hypothetical protein
MNKFRNAGCGTLIAIGLVILFAIVYWQFSLVVVAICFVIWWYTHKSEHAKQKQAEQAKAQEQLLKAKEQKIAEYQQIDLRARATKSNIVNLKPKEWIYYTETRPITWSETRSKIKRINYGGLTSNVHIMKGLNYRAGSVRTEIQHEDYIKQIFKGSPLLTNRRIILYNSSDGIAKAYPFTRLLKATAYTDGTVLSSESGKQVILTGFENPDAFNVILQRLSNNNENVEPY